MKAGLGILGFVVLAVLGTYFLIQRAAPDPYRAPDFTPIETTHEETPPAPAETQGASIGDENLVEFVCADGKTMTAVFTRDIVGLTLSDGRQLTLRQAESGSGIRYLNNTQTIEFRGQGDEAFLIEGETTTYAECKNI